MLVASAPSPAKFPGSGVLPDGPAPETILTGGGGPQSALEGNAKLSVDFTNMPRGVRTKLAIDGLFKDYKLSRGRQMGNASELR
jgi:hypothetical protein